MTGYNDRAPTMARRTDDEFEAELARLVAYGDPMRRFGWLTFQNLMTAFTAFCGGVLLVYQVGGKAKEIDLGRDVDRAKVAAIETRLNEVDQKLATNVVTRQEFTQLQQDVRDIKVFLMGAHTR